MTQTPGYETTIGVVDPTTPGDSMGMRRPELARGTMVGRYQIIKLIGRGGMGSVYAAHDPNLDRQVALKLLHSTGNYEAAERMIREAQALARLDDPHVVQVYDAGEYDDQVFITMQLVDGEDLAAAIARKKPSVPQIIAWFCAAGRGLGAAHAAGLIHRDFKPNNVLVDSRGRVAVTDFGLARSLDAPTNGRSLTSVGTIMGTPAYMSPEQHGQLSATPASDQFSFCIALWEALYDRHPFIAGDRTSIGSMSPFAIGYQIYDGELILPPKQRHVPRRVHDALVRGLSRDPSKRWPTMGLLIAELAPAQKRRVWPLLLGAGAIAGIAGGATMWLVVDQGKSEPTCALQTAERANAAWSTATAQQLHAQFGKSGRTYAEAAALQARTSLDRYTTRWQQMAADVCEAERAAGGQAPDLVVRRRGCLDNRLDALRGLTTMLIGETKPEFVDRAQAMVDALPDLGDCIDESVASTPPAAIAAEITKLDLAINGAEARAIAGDFGRARTEAAQVLTRADQLQWAPLQSRANFVVGKIATAQVDSKLGREHLVKAAELATANQLDREAARAWAQAQLAAGTDGAADVVATLAPMARGAAARTKDKELIAMAKILHARALVRARKWKDGADACKAAYDDVLKLDKRTLHDEARICMIEALVPMGKTAEFEPILAKLIDDKSKEVGADHPTVSDLLKVRIGSELRQGKLAEARKTAERVYEIRKRVYPAQHMKNAEALEELGSVSQAEGKDKEAFEQYKQALAATDDTKIEQVILITSLRTTLAMMENGEGKDGHKRALDHFEKAIALVKKTSGPESIEHAVLLINYGQIKSEDNVEVSLGLLGEARRIFEKHKDKRASAPATAMAIVAWNAKRYEDARRFADEALVLLDKNAPPHQVAYTKSIQARAMWETGGDKKRARQLALEAKAMFEKLGPGAASSVKSLEAWLAKHK
ncbi:MAG TPA: protein kinase [Kofleriaceae bacterium]